MKPQPLNTEMGQISISEAYVWKVFFSLPHGHPGVSIRKFRRHGKKLYPTDDGVWINAKHLDHLIELLQAAHGHHLSSQQARAKVMKARDEDYRRRNGGSPDPFDPDEELCYSVLCDDPAPAPEPPKRVTTEHQAIREVVRAKKKANSPPAGGCEAGAGG